MSRDSDCIFCKIYEGTQQSNVVYRDDEVVVFSDIKPASTHHYLIVTKEHIKDAKQLTKNQIPLVKKLMAHANRILQEKGADMNDVRFGFHWPPFHTIPHLHLHAISPASGMSFLARMIFKSQSLWFVSPEYVLMRLEKL